MINVPRVSVHDAQIAAQEAAIRAEFGEAGVARFRELLPRDEELPHAVTPCSAPDNTVQSGEIGRNTDVTKQAQNRAEKEEL